MIVGGYEVISLSAPGKPRPQVLRNLIGCLCTMCGMDGFTESILSTNASMMSRTAFTDLTLERFRDANTPIRYGAEAKCAVGGSSSTARVYFDYGIDTWRALIMIEAYVFYSCSQRKPIRTAIDQLCELGIALMLCGEFLVGTILPDDEIVPVLGRSAFLRNPPTDWALWNGTVVRALDSETLNRADARARISIPIEDGGRFWAFRDYDAPRDIRMPEVEKIERELQLAISDVLPRIIASWNARA